MDERISLRRKIPVYRLEPFTRASKRGFARNPVNGHGCRRVKGFGDQSNTNTHIHKEACYGGPTVAEMRIVVCASVRVYNRINE